MDKSGYADRRRGVYTIGEIAKLYHIGTDTIRYYERKGILEPTRGENGYRYYSDQSIWRMNVIRELRSLDFPVERIRDYFQDRTPQSTEQLLREELALIGERLEQLEALEQSVRQQLDTLEEVKSLRFGQVIRRRIPERRAFAIYQEHSRDEETDLLMKRLAERSGGHVQIAGNRRMATMIAPDRDGPLFQGAMIFDPRGDVVVPGGDHLSVFYQGPTDSRRHLEMLQDYAAAEGLVLCPPFLEIIWLDIHTATDPEQFISEVQARIQ